MGLDSQSFHFEGILTQQILKNILKYDKYTGIFTWLINIKKIKFGDIAGSITKNGYTQIMIDGKNYKAHRLAWLYVLGKWPENDIDHKDRNKSNNIWENLRDVTRSLNMLNTGLRIDNTSGVTGVSYVTSRKMWQADYCGIRLGIFDSKEEAIRSRKLAEIEGA